MRTDDGLWMPDGFEKQFKVFNCRARALLCVGPRLSGKTRAVLHRVVRHLWETPDARVGMYAKVGKQAKAVGSWKLLHSVTIKEWIKANIGLRYTSTKKDVPGPTEDINRTPYFSITNAHGGQSEMYLFALDHDDDAEEKMKDAEFSMIFLSELDKFLSKKVLTVALASLRMGHLRYEDQMWIADCNPSEEGEQSWIYQTFYVERGMTFPEYREHQRKMERPDSMTEEDFNLFYGKLEVIEILPEDNIFVDKRQLQEIKVACGNDPGLYARLIKGKWVWGGGDSSRHFRSLIGNTVCGNISGDQWEILIPSDGCYKLTTGWDVGEAVNHAACAMEVKIIADKKHFYVVEENVSIARTLSVRVFTEQFMAKIDALEEECRRKFLIEDTAYADQSSITKYNAVADTYPHMEVRAASGERVFLRGVPKPAGSVRMRVKVLQDLLREGRLHVSAHCVGVIKMLMDLKVGKIYFVMPDDDNRHIFDALTYAILMEMAEELQDSDRSKLLTVPAKLPFEVHI